MNSIALSDTEILAALKKSAEENRNFFSNKGKEARERWVVAQFLQHRSLTFLETELISPHQDSKIDVHFREANFQVKEIVTPGSKRSDEIRRTYEQLEAATNLAEVISSPFVYDTPHPTTIYSLASEKASCLAFDKQYIIAKHELDLLFYVTYTHASLILKEEINTEHLASLGWRSISCLAGTQATVLLAQAHAPTFLRLY